MKFNSTNENYEIKMCAKNTQMYWLLKNSKNVYCITGVFSYLSRTKILNKKIKGLPIVPLSNRSQNCAFIPFIV